MSSPGINFLNFGPVLGAVATDVSQILADQGTQMSEFSDLQTAVSNLTSGIVSLTTAVDQAVTLLQRIASGNTVTSAYADAAINPAVSNLATETADLTAAEAPPPASP